MSRRPASAATWRRFGLALTLVGLASAGCVSQASRVDVVAFEGPGDGSSDATQAIQAAIDALGDAGGTVRLPAGTFVHQGVIRLRSRVTLEGVGDQTVLLASEPTQAAIAAVDVSDVTIRNVKLASRATQRRSDLYSHQLTIAQAEGARVEGVHIDGSAAAGIFIHGSRRVRVSGCKVANTLADGIHTTGGSREVIVRDNQLADTGDDAVAVVSYRRDTAACQDVSIHDNHITRSRSRGLAVVGGQRVSVARNTVAGSRYAGLYAASETFYDTMGCSDLRFTDNQLQDVNRLPSPDIPYQGILLSGRAGFAVERVLLQGNRVTRAGFRGIEANAFVRGALIRDNHLAEVADIGICLGGHDMVATGNTVSGAGSYGLAVTETARGATILSGNTVERPNGQGIGHVDAINVDARSLSLLVLADTRLLLAGAIVERTIEVLPGAGRIVIGGNAGATSPQLVVGRPNARWDASVRTVSAPPTSASWRQDDVVVIEDASHRVGVWGATASGDAAYSEVFSLSYPASPMGEAE
jgi:hypothetical protein